MSIASVAAQQSAAAGTTATSPTTSPTAAGALSGNMSTFLNLLMTQLQNQDPTSPLDTAQFTSQLVQYSGVEQQIQTNSSLTNLIQLTQGNEVIQSSSVLGKTVAVSSDHLALQTDADTGKSGAEVDFTATGAGTVGIAITNAQGQQIAGGSLDGRAGLNKWSWDGTDLAGNQLPDGSYKVVVTQNNADGSATALPTTIIGTATGVTTNGSAVQVDLGDLAVDFAALQSVTPKAAQ